MKIFTETDRLLLREVVPTDQDGFFELDTDPDVHTYLGNKPITTIDQAQEAVQFIRQQYIDHGIGRWAVIEKESNAFVGWSGLKLITAPINGLSNYHDLGYRFVKSSWGKGYATEAALATIHYGFTTLKLDKICAIADIQNQASNRILSKIGLQRTDEFEYENTPHYFYKITRDEWEMGKS